MTILSRPSAPILAATFLLYTSSILHSSSPQHSLPITAQAFTATRRTSTARTRTGTAVERNTRTTTTTTTTTTPHSNTRTLLHDSTNNHYDDFGEDFFFPPQDDNGNNNNEEGDGSSSNNAADSDLYAALRARQASLEECGLLESSSCIIHSENNTPDNDDQAAHQLSIRYNWKEANCVSSVRLTLGDWIRRIAVDLYPLVVCGSARGHLYLADLEAESRTSLSSNRMMQTTSENGRNSVGQLDCLKHVHASHLEESVDIESPELLNEALEVLFGNYDGGGVLTIAAKKDLIVSSGREGGVHICSIVGEEEEVFTGSRYGGKSKQTKLYLNPMGRMLGIEQPESWSPLLSPTTNYDSPPLITSIVFDDQGTLWIAGYDGILRGYDYEQVDDRDRPAMMKQKHADHEVDLKSPILSITVNDAIGCGVAATLDKGIVLFALQDGKVLKRWNPFANSKRGEIARSAMIIQTDEPQEVDEEMTRDSIYPESHWSVIVGGSKGTLFQRRLGIRRQNGYISEKTPFLDIEVGVAGRRIRPNHLGQIVAMGSPSTGILVTGSHDGTMRVWDCSLYKNDEDDAAEDEQGGDFDITIETMDGSSVGDVKEDSTSRTKRPRVLYALSGYKVWLGSIFANDRKLVSDGADNSIIVHSFDEDEENVLRSREEDEDDTEDFTFD